MNSRQKGKRAELEVAAWLRMHGWNVRRGQQFSGSHDSPDIVAGTTDRPFPYHIEVKRVEKLNLIDACAQAEGDCGGKPWVVLHRRNQGPWLVTLLAEGWIELVNKTAEPNHEYVQKG